MNAPLPPLPAEVSPNGAEVWDWAARFSEAVHRRAKMNELRGEIAQVRCGDCNHWMKSRSCPRERNVQGMSRGPSAGAPVCSHYSESTTSVARRESKAAELAALVEQAK